MFQLGTKKYLSKYNKLSASLGQSIKSIRANGCLLRVELLDMLGRREDCTE